MRAAVFSRSASSFVVRPIALGAFRRNTSAVARPTVSTANRPADGRREHRVPLRPPPEPDDRPGRLRADRLEHADAAQLLREVERRLVAAVTVLLERGLDDDRRSVGTDAVRCARDPAAPSSGCLVDALARRGVERPRERQRTRRA